VVCCSKHALLWPAVQQSVTDSYVTRLDLFKCLYTYGLREERTSFWVDMPACLQVVFRTVCEFRTLTIKALKFLTFLALNKLKYWGVNYIPGSEGALLIPLVEDQIIGTLKTVEVCVTS